MGSLTQPSSASHSPQTVSLLSHAGTQTPLHLTASVKQTLKDRESGELDTFLTVELAQASSEYLGLTILLEPRPGWSGLRMFQSTDFANSGKHNFIFVPDGPVSVSALAAQVRSRVRSGPADSSLRALPGPG